MSIAKARKLISDTERELRTILAQAAAGGDYAAVTELTGMARQLAALAAPPISAVAAPQNADLECALSTPARDVAHTVDRPSRTRPARAADYPRFLRHGDELIKIGWSKRERDEYQHKAPHTALAALVAAITRVGTRGKRFASHALLPLRDASDTTVPDYQMYVCLAFLKHHGLIEQHGRQGYSLADPASLGRATEAVWSRLPEI